MMAALHTNARNPLVYDPSRTTGLRNRIARAVRKRFMVLRRELIDLVAVQDAFGLRPRHLVVHRQFAFLSTSDQVDAFERWLRTRIDADIFEATAAGALKPDYWHEYVAEGYTKGAGRAFEDTRKARRAAGAAGDVETAFFQGSKEEFLQQAFAHPQSIDKVKLLAGRTFADLKGVTDAMSQVLRQTLAAGFVEGLGMRAIAKQLTERLDMSRRRAEAIARTEIIRAHAEGQLDSLERLGVAEVGVMVEWSTAGDDRVCPACADLAGLVLTIQEARGIIPRHTSCRCVYLPANVGESKKKQKRSQREIQDAMDASLGRDLPRGRIIKGARRRYKDAETGLFTRRTPPKTLADLRKESAWAGATKRIAKRRPVGPLD